MTLNKWDKIFIGKKYVDALDGIEGISKGISNTTDMQIAIIDGSGIKDTRPSEMMGLSAASTKIEMFVLSNGFSLDDLQKWMDDYKRLTFGEMMEVKQNKTLVDDFYENQ